METLSSPPHLDESTPTNEGGEFNDGPSPEDSPENDVELSIGSIHSHASEVGLPDDFTDEAVSAFTMAGSPENIASGLQSLDQRMAQMHEITQNIESGLEATSEMLNEFIKELIQMIETIEEYMDRILSAEDENEKSRLTQELQQQINQFGGNF